MRTSRMERIAIINLISMSLEIHNLHIAVDADKIVNGVSLEIKHGEVHAIMGPNGSGKSTFANTLMGHPKYQVTQGSVVVDGTDITELAPDERAKLGLFLSMQYAPEIPGVTVTNFLRLAVEAKTGKKQNPLTFFGELKEKMNELKIDTEFAKRYLNVGFSGGEKKRLEVLQLSMLNPTYAILDETDSGLDVDALKIVSEGITNFASDKKGILLITHYNRILEYVKPDYVHIMHDGRIIKSGGAELAHVVEEKGYDQFLSA